MGSKSLPNMNLTLNTYHLQLLVLLFLKVRGFRGTHGTHANYAPAFEERLYHIFSSTMLVGLNMQIFCLFYLQRPKVIIQFSKLDS